MGFLFGIPKSGTAATTKVKQNDSFTSSEDAMENAGADRKSSTDARPNTNLEEISDWITKIIVGLTLVHLQTIEGRIQSVCANAAASFGANPTASDISFATALVAAFSVLGFLAGYLYTRLFLQGAFARSDGDLRRDWNEVVRKEFKKRQMDPPEDTSKPSLPTREQVESAQRVRQVAPADNPEVVLRPLRQLVAEYEQIRRSLPPGDERTRSLSGVVRRMSTLALAAAPFLPQLAHSDSPGERLAAVVILKFKFDPSFINWLQECLINEPAFVAYHAASALLGGVRLLGPSEKDGVKKSVEAIQAQLASKGMNDPGVHMLLDEILES